MIDREKAKQIYFKANGFLEAGPTYKDTLELHDRFTERISYLYSEIKDLEFKDRELFKLKITELYLLLRETNHSLNEFERKLEKILEFNIDRGFMKHPREVYSSVKSRIDFFMKHLENED